MSTVRESTNVDLINKLWRRFAAAITAGDLDRWLDLWAEDGKQMPPGAPARIGQDEIREGTRPMSELFDTQMTISPDEVRILGDYAFSHGIFEYAMTPKEGGETVRRQGKFLTILARQSDGSWKIAIDCFNNNAPVDSV